MHFLLLLECVYLFLPFHSVLISIFKSRTNRRKV
jgi:hypothetical protein